MSKSATARVQEAIMQKGFEFQIVELPDTTRSAEQAAEAIGCKVEEIAKSIIFQGQSSGKPYLVIASGINRVDEQKISKLAKEPIIKPNADFVKEKTGFTIGGVAPVGHSQTITTWIDKDLLQYKTIWAAAGSPFSVFKLDAAKLKALTAGTVTNVKE